VKCAFRSRTAASSVSNDHAPPGLASAVIAASLDHRLDIVDGVGPVIALTSTRIKRHPEAASSRSAFG
jgi:hypothetical protein